jgi:hypothetical protein
MPDILGVIMQLSVRSWDLAQRSAIYRPRLWWPGRISLTIRMCW